MASQESVGSWVHATSYIDMKIQYIARMSNVRISYREVLKMSSRSKSIAVTSHNRFISEVVDYLVKHDLDGVEYDWEGSSHKDPYDWNGAEGAIDRENSPEFPRGYSVTMKPSGPARS